MLVDQAEDSAWDENQSVRRLKVRDLKSNTVSMAMADYLIPAIGRFSAWKLPDISGIENFQGHLRHASNWDFSFDPTEKSVAVIGNGASGIQLGSKLQKVVKRSDNYARNRSFWADSFLISHHFAVGHLQPQAI